eukprot:TRINITY_DN5501_c1_g3_i7.p1 TRINITY_DN5501_c1_g3~~TRINITY_DN5501_c1_g3_i7.p1  ORF type:complete len:162 (-),score=9.55 TRINITY_DN5501_c1_g3_i7:369-854(-)
MPFVAPCGAGGDQFTPALVIYSPLRGRSSPPAGAGGERLAPRTPVRGERNNPQRGRSGGGKPKGPLVSGATHALRRPLRSPSPPAGAGGVEFTPPALVIYSLLRGRSSFPLLGGSCFAKEGLGYHSDAKNSLIVNEESGQLILFQLNMIIKHPKGLADRLD